MATMRPQYHFRRTRSGVDAWNVKRLIELSRGLPAMAVDPRSFSELDENHWYFHDEDLVPTPNSFIEHMKIVSAVDLSFPIILDQSGRVMDGMHRVVRAILEGVPEIPAVQFEVDPEPDFMDCDPRTLPYDP